MSIWGAFLAKMIISKLSLVNFRNHNKINLEFNPHMNIIIGDNASGKTNILEAIIVLALTKSYKNVNDTDLITFSKSKLKVKGNIRDEKIFKNLEVEITKEGKMVKLNNKRVNCLAEYVSNLKVVTFMPNDLELIKGSPNIRRNLLNIELSQLSSLYLTTYNQYNKLLKTRNEYLKLLFTNGIADKNYFDILTDKLIEKAIVVYKLRYQYLKRINTDIDNIFKNITGQNGIRILYKPNINFDKYEADVIKTTMTKIYKINYQRELHLGMTIFGPHRDDFQFIYQENDMKLYSSQGQQKSAVLAYKLATISIFNEKSGTKPVLLLDDIFGELDLKKKNRLLKYINTDIQSIITTTDLKNISKNALATATIFSISNGEIERRNN